jgi:carbonic anhydrase
MVHSYKNRNSVFISFQAMNLLHSLQCQEFSSKKNRRISPLRAWLSAHASSSLEKFQQLEVSGYQKPLIFQAETPMRKFVAYIDPENSFSVADKLSQVQSVTVEPSVY